jgi:hypothetical protein
MQYFKTATLAAAAAVVGFVLILGVQLVALKQYFDNGVGRGIGEIAWTVPVSYYASLAVLAIAAFWAGRRSGRLGRWEVAAMVAGPLVAVLFHGFWLLAILVVTCVSDLRAEFSFLGLAQVGVVVSAVLGGAVGAWTVGREASGT